MVSHFSQNMFPTLFLLEEVGMGIECKWPDKSTTSYDMSDFKSYIKSLARKYWLIKL